MFGMVAAKKMIMLDWKTPNPPRVRKLLNEMTNIIQMERMRFHRSKAQNKSMDIWGRFIDYLKDQYFESSF